MKKPIKIDFNDICKNSQSTLIEMINGLIDKKELLTNVRINLAESDLYPNASAIQFSEIDEHLKVIEINLKTIENAIIHIETKISQLILGNMIIYLN
jgi:hypothetical protein